MSINNQLETSLDSLFGKAPRLSVAAKRSVVSVWPVLAAVLALSQILAVMGLWYLSRSMQEVSRQAVVLKDLIDGPLPTSGQADYMLVYAGMAVLAVSAFLFIAALPELRKRTPRAFFLVAAAIFFNILYGILMLFIEGRGVYGFLISIIGSTAGLYLLYQTKQFFIKQPKTKIHKKKAV